MKKLFYFISMALLLSSCIEQSKTEEPSARWNGYFHFLKSGEVMHTLWAGKHINIGTVTYGIDEDANFYACYDCSGSGWTISETHLYAGTLSQMPLNKPGRPKIGNFPCLGVHHPRVSTFTYRIPLTQLPPSSNPGFVVAAHCVAHSPYGQNETAWAEGDYTFSDKGWGWYDTYYYDPQDDETNVLYGTVYRLDSLVVYHLDINSGASAIIMTEFVGEVTGTYDGAAYDDASGLFFFANYATGALWANFLNDDEPSFCTGTLSGISASGTFHDGAYYYVEEGSNSIRRVDFNGSWYITGETILDTVPSSVTVFDVAMDPAGDYLYLTGSVSGGASQLFVWEAATGQFYQSSLGIGDDVQIAFGNDGELYAITPLDSSGGSGIYTISLEGETISEIDAEAIVIADDPFSDLTKGPGWQPSYLK